MPCRLHWVIFFFRSEHYWPVWSRFPHPPAGDSVVVRGCSVQVLSSLGPLGLSRVAVSTGRFKTMLSPQTAGKAEWEGQ